MWLGHEASGGGDGGGHLKAARASNAVFFPKPPGPEEEVCANAREVFDAFFEGY